MLLIREGENVNSKTVLDCSKRPQEHWDHSVE